QKKVPGATITAAGTNQHLQAHGGGIIQVDDVFYMIGENKLNGSAYQSLNCYSSKDLVSWTFVNEVLTLQPSGDLGPNRVVERPHVIYNEKTARYVMWMHIDSSNYGEAKAGVASCASVCGDYDYAGSVQPLGFQSRDMNLFKGTSKPSLLFNPVRHLRVDVAVDTDGAGYLTTEDRKNGLRIDRLSDDFMTVNSAVYLWPGRHEASAIYKSGDTYFMFASYQSGWDPNDNEYCTATKLSGPWSAWTKFTPAGSKTFRSQTAAVVSINGTNRTSWILNPRAGTWAPAPTETSAQAEDAANTLSNGAKILNCAACSGGKSVGFIGGPPGGTLTFTNVTSSMATTTTLRVQYVNGDHTQRYANVIVNGLASVMAFLPTEGGVPMSSTLTVPLKAGANTVCFEAFNGGWAPDIDQIIVPVS
ncbi:hypothetical protein JHW43_003577, partial [Diplocarpon mali]